VNGSSSHLGGPRRPQPGAKRSAVLWNWVSGSWQSLLEELPGSLVWVGLRKSGSSLALFLDNTTQKILSFFFF